MDGISTVETGFIFQPGYSVMVLLGLCLVLGFPVTKDITEPTDRRSYYTIQAITLLGALLGAKLAVLMGDALWPLEHFDDWAALIVSGRSIIGALVVGFVVAEIAKPLMGYRLPPNDRFAVVLPFSIAIGRIGCYLAGCCRGLPYDGPFATTYADGISRHPIWLYELGFHVVAGLLLFELYRCQLLRARLFALYLVMYGGFRFINEALRVTEKAFGGFSAYQWFALAAVLLGLTGIIARSFDPNSSLSKRRLAA